MARIQPINVTELSPSVQVAFERHIEDYNGSITNSKGILAHSLLSFEVYMQWHPLYLQVEKILGNRLAYLYAYAISKASECSICIAFFRKIIIDAGERPESLSLSPSQKEVVDFGASIARYHGNINDHVYNSIADLYTKEDIVALVAFAGQMIATNVFNNVVETEIDEHLAGYLPSVKIK